MCASVSRFHQKTRACFAISEIAGFFWPLFSGESEGFAVFLDHLAHLADALGALGLAALVAKDVDRARGASVDGGAHFALADAVTIADVQGRNALPD
jgi:hypothetical protein